MSRPADEPTGDGHKMGVWAGGEIEPTTHTKMIHDAAWAVWIRRICW